MDHISGNTFLRAFLAAPVAPTREPVTVDLGKVAGDYENTTCTKITKSLVGVLTLGIGYGIIWLIERCGNVDPKIDEFRRAAADLHATILREPQQIGENAQVRVFTQEGNEIKFCQTANGVRITDRTGDVGLLRGWSIADIGETLHNNFVAYHNLYAPFLTAQNVPENILTANQDFQSLRYSEDGNYPEGRSRQPSEFDSYTGAQWPPNPGIAPSAEPFEQRFAALPADVKTLVTHCAQLKAFMRPAINFLSIKDHQHLSAAVAHFLTGDVSHLPEGLAVPLPNIPLDVKHILRELLAISDDDSSRVIFERISALDVKVFFAEVDALCPADGSFHREMTAEIHNRRGADTGFFDSLGSPDRDDRRG